MNDHELVMALDKEYGGDESGDLDTAIAFVRFVQSLPETDIHPDDVDDNNKEGDPRWTALALEYVFSDDSYEAHAEIVIEFFATLTAAQRTRAWTSVHAQASRIAPEDAELGEPGRTLLEALAERIGT